MSWEQLTIAATAISASAGAGLALIALGHQVVKVGRAMRWAWLRRRNKRRGQ
jgi:hypothetical protein